MSEMERSASSVSKLPTYFFSEWKKLEEVELIKVDIVFQYRHLPVPVLPDSTMSWFCVVDNNVVAILVIPPLPPIPVHNVCKMNGEGPEGVLSATSDYINFAPVWPTCKTGGGVQNKRTTCTDAPHTVIQVRCCGETHTLILKKKSAAGRTLLARFLLWAS